MNIHPNVMTSQALSWIPGCIHHSFFHNANRILGSWLLRSSFDGRVLGLCI